MIILNRDDFLKTKYFFQNSDFDNHFIHQLIYIKLKGKSIYSCCGSGRKGFKKYFQKLLFILKVIKNKEQYYFYIKTRFPYVDWFIICQILKEIEFEINN